ncbi:MULTISPECIES: hypothetical protein [Clostridium]|uniref:hypothetical protein n=1 Tax=Clostridium TaxID=1485 RepID=UPI001C9B2D7A|nr:MULTISPECIES: hypothetical protein [Clostridium]MBY7024153.1 hypothetical protein [Clostridium botulinum]
MKFMIKPKYQYVLLIFHYALIGIITIVNYFQVKKYKQAINITILFIIILIFDLIIYQIIIENFNVVILGISLITIYNEILNIGIGYLLIRNQKKNIEFI